MLGFRLQGVGRNMNGYVVGHVAQGQGTMDSIFLLGSPYPATSY